MKVYDYLPQDAWRDKFPLGELRVSGCEKGTPEDADVFVMPMAIRHLGKDLYKLPYLKGNEKKHVFFNLSEDVKLWYDLPCLFIRADATKEIKAHDPNTIGWPWPVKDLWRPHQGFRYDVVFQGWASTPLTNIACESVKKTKLSAHIQVHNYFFGYHYDDPTYKHLIDSYLDTLSKSRLSLVPRSLPEGVVRYRFYEALSMGRVPVHFCDHRILPFGSKIDYGKCSIHIPEKDAEHTGEILTQWLATHSDEQIIEMGLYGREMWSKWLDSAKWGELYKVAIEEHLAK